MRRFFLFKFNGADEAATRCLSASPWHNFKFREHVLDAYKMVIEDVFGHVQKPEDGFIADGVIHILAFFSSVHHVPASQLGQLLRKRALFNFQTDAQIIDPDFSVPESSNNPNSQGLGEYLEKISLKSWML